MRSTVDEPTDFGKPGFHGEMTLHYVDGRVWELHNPQQQWGFVTPDGIVIEPQDGFITDFASIPRLFWPVLGAPTGDGPAAAYGPEAVIHDWLYAQGELYGDAILREFADETFLQAMIALKVAPWRRNLLFFGVRLGGWLTWRWYRKTDRG